MKRLEGNVTIITGGGKGIGFGMATAFAREGSNLVLTGRNMERLQQAQQKLESEWGVKVLPIVADGSDENAVKMVVAKTAETFGKIDTLINNAQVSKSGLPLIQHTREDLDMAVLSGIYATFFYMRECFPYLKESGGSVINFASGAGLYGKPGQSSYAAAKEGIRGLSRVAATEWGPDGVRVNVSRQHSEASADESLPTRQGDRSGRKPRRDGKYPTRNRETTPQGSWPQGSAPLQYSRYRCYRYTQDPSA